MWLRWTAKTTTDGKSPGIPRRHSFSLGHTIAMTPTSDRDNGVLPAPTASQIIDAVPGLNALPGSLAGEAR